MTRKAEPTNPSIATRFQKLESGNPKGRPKAKAKKGISAFDIIVEKTLTVTRNGVPREITVEEALQHRTYQDALAGDRSARREVLKMIAKREKFLAQQSEQQNRKRPAVVALTEPKDPDNADHALLLLGIASHDPRRQHYKADNAQLLLEPWAVQVALSRRRGGTSLLKEEVAEINRCTRDPDKLRWPRSVRE